MIRLLQILQFLMNGPEPIRQSGLLMVLASGLGDSKSLQVGLQSLAAESRPPWASKVTQLGMLLDQGQTIADALVTVKDLLPYDTVTAIRIAEETGTLRPVLVDEAQRLMARTSDVSPIQASLASTMAICCAVALSCLFLLTFVMLFIIPKYKKIFEDFGTDLPEMTQTLVHLSSVFSDYWYAFLFPLLTVVLLPWWWMLRWGLTYVSTGHVRFSEHFPRARAPLVLRMLSLVVASGNTIADGLGWLQKELLPGRAARCLSAARHEVVAGNDFWAALRNHGFLNKKEMEFISAAAVARDPDWALLHVAKSIQRSHRRTMRRLATMLQPAVILLIGFCIGFVCIALFLPLIKLTNDCS